MSSTTDLVLTGGLSVVASSLIQLAITICSHLRIRSSCCYGISGSVEVGQNNVIVESKNSPISNKKIIEKNPQIPLSTQTSNPNV